MVCECVWVGGSATVATRNRKESCRTSYYVLLCTHVNFMYTVVKEKVYSYNVTGNC